MEQNEEQKSLLDGGQILDYDTVKVLDCNTDKETKGNANNLQIETSKQKHKIAFKKAMKNFLTHNNDFHRVIDMFFDDLNIKKLLPLNIVKTSLKHDEKNNRVRLCVIFVTDNKEIFIKIGDVNLFKTIIALGAMSAMGFAIPLEKLNPKLYDKNNENSIKSILQQVLDIAKNITGCKSEGDALNISVQYNTSSSIKSIFCKKSMDEKNGSYKIVSEIDKMSLKDALFLLWIELALGINDNLARNTKSVLKKNNKKKNTFFDPIFLNDDLTNLLLSTKREKIDLKKDVSDIGTYEYLATRALLDFSKLDSIDEFVKKFCVKMESGAAYVKSQYLKDIIQYIQNEIKKIVIMQAIQNCQNFTKNNQNFKAKSFCPFQKASFELCLSRMVLDKEIEMVKNKNEYSDSLLILLCNMQNMYRNMNVEISKAIHEMQITEEFNKQYNAQNTHQSQFQNTAEYGIYENYRKNPIKFVGNMDPRLNRGLLKLFAMDYGSNCKLFSSGQDLFFNTLNNKNVFYSRNTSNRYNIYQDICGCIVYSAVAIKNLNLFLVAEILMYAINSQYSAEKPNQLFKDDQIVSYLAPEITFLNNVYVFCSSFYNLAIQNGLFKLDTHSPLEVKDLSKDIIMEQSILFGITSLIKQEGNLSLEPQISDLCSRLWNTNQLTKNEDKTIMEIALDNAKHCNKPSATQQVNTFNALQM